MLDPSTDTLPLSALRDNPTELLHQLKTTQRPITLTIDGQPQAILQDPEAYQRLLDLAALADPEEGLRQGLEDIAEGRTRPAREFFAEMRSKYNIPE